MDFYYFFPPQFLDDFISENLQKGNFSTRKCERVGLVLRLAFIPPLSSHMTMNILCIYPLPYDDTWLPYYGHWITYYFIQDEVISLLLTP